MTNDERVLTDPFFVNTEFFHAWRAGLGTLNRGKVGAPFEFPPSFFDYLAHVRARCDMDYRALEAFAALLLQQGRPRLAAQGFLPDVLERLRAPHFTQIRRRLANAVMRLDTAAKLARQEPMHILLDVDGAHVATPSEWARVYVGQRVSRGWYRLDLTSLVPRPLGAPRPGQPVPRIPRVPADAGTH